MDNTLYIRRPIIPLLIPQRPALLMSNLVLALPLPLALLQLIH
jgi:hypothetical protein